jgi:hypothetical protein
MVYSLLILIFTILTMIIYDKAGQNTPIPEPWRKVMQFLHCISNKKGQNKVAGKSKDRGLKGQTAKDLEQRNNEETAGDLEDNTQGEGIKCSDFFTWQELGNLTNRACWKLFLVLIVFNWVLYFCIMIVAISGNSSI